MASTEHIKLRPRRRYTAAIDPGASTGIAVHDRAFDKIVSLYTTNFFGVSPWLMRNFRMAELIVYVEVPAIFMYDRSNMQEDRVRDNYMAKVGGVHREAELLAELLRRDGYEVQEVPPIRKKKWTDAQFQMLTKWRGPTNQHCRDAARLALHYATKREELINV